MSIHPSRLVYLVNPDVITVRAKYEPDINASYEFKTLDKTLTKGDIVIVPTDTRCGFTCVEISEVDVDSDVEATSEIKWIVGRVDTPAFEKTLEAEKELQTTYRQMQRRKRRAELASNLFDDQAGAFDDNALVSKGDQADPAPLAAPDAAPDAAS